MALNFNDYDDEMAAAAQRKSEQQMAGETAKPPPFVKLVRKQGDSSPYGEMIFDPPTPTYKALFEKALFESVRVKELAKYETVARYGEPGLARRMQEIIDWLNQPISETSELLEGKVFDEVIDQSQELPMVREDFKAQAQIGFIGTPYGEMSISPMTQAEQALIDLGVIDEEDIAAEAQRTAIKRAFIKAQAEMRIGFWGTHPIEPPPAFNQFTKEEVCEKYAIRPSDFNSLCGFEPGHAPRIDNGIQLEDCTLIAAYIVAPRELAKGVIHTITYDSFRLATHITFESEANPPGITVKLWRKNDASVPLDPVP